MTKGLVRIRLARFGRMRQPVYNIVVTQSWKARDVKPIEVLGTYNPIPKPLTAYEKRKGHLPQKDIALDFDRVKYWIGTGAQPSEPVIKLLTKAGILGQEWSSREQKETVLPKREVVE